MPLNVSLVAGITAELTGTAVGNDVPRFSKMPGAPLVLTDGTGSYQANKWWSSVRSLASGANEDLDLAGSLTDPFGATITFTYVKMIVMRAAVANTTTFTLGGAASNQFSGFITAAAQSIRCPPGGFIVLANPSDGWAVTAGTGDLLRVTNSSGATATYAIDIVGI